MALSQKQKLSGLRLKKLADSGDSKAAQALNDIERMNPRLWTEYKALFDGDGAGVPGGVKRSDLPDVDTKALSNNQFRMAVVMTNRAKEKKADAIQFFAAQEDEATKGSNVAKAYLGVRDAIFAGAVIEASAVQKPSGPGTIANQEKPVEHVSSK